MFVHGLFGSHETWSALLNHLRHDEYFKHAKPFLFEFESPKRTCFLLRNIPRLGTVANKLCTYLESERVDQYEHIIFVGHSLGGLVIQKFLLDYRDYLTSRLKHLRRVMLIATPNNGSEFLLASRWLVSRVMRHPHEILTRPFNQEIEELQTGMARYYGAPIGSQSQGIDFDVFVGSTDRIVTPGSARGVFRDVHVLPGDHSGVLRPTTADAQICTSILNSIRLCRECLPPHCTQLSVRSLDPRVASADVARLARQLFPPHAHFAADELSAASEYYATRGALQVRVLGAFVNEELCGFSLFTETPLAIVIGYIGVAKGGPVSGCLRQALFVSLVQRIRARATELGRPVLFEVKRPMTGSTKFTEDRARVRLFVKHGARIISGINYKAPDMARIGEFGTEESYLLMYGRDGAMPDYLDKQEVLRTLSHFYDIAYLHWFAPTAGEERVRAYLSRLAADVMEQSANRLPLVAK